MHTQLGGCFAATEVLYTSMLSTVLSVIVQLRDGVMRGKGQRHTTSPTCRGIASRPNIATHAARSENKVAAPETDPSGSSPQGRCALLD